MAVRAPLACDEFCAPRSSAEPAEASPPVLELEGQGAAGDQGVFRKLWASLPEQFTRGRIDHVYVAQRAKGNSVLDRQRDTDGNRGPAKI